MQDGISGYRTNHCEQLLRRALWMIKYIYYTFIKWLLYLLTQWTFEISRSLKLRCDGTIKEFTMERSLSRAKFLRSHLIEKTFWRNTWGLRLALFNGAGLSRKPSHRKQTWFAMREPTLARNPLCVRCAERLSRQNIMGTTITGTATCINEFLVCIILNTIFHTTLW